MEKILLILLVVLLAVTNLIAFGQMGADKRRAQNGQRRVREMILFLTAAIGGSLGANLGMWVFRHKTKHASFLIGMPLILVAHIVLAVVIYLCLR